MYVQERDPTLTPSIFGVSFFMQRHLVKTTTVSFTLQKKAAHATNTLWMEETPAKIPQREPATEILIQSAEDGPESWQGKLILSSAPGQ